MNLLYAFAALLPVVSTQTSALEPTSLRKLSKDPPDLEGSTGSPPEFAAERVPFNNGEHAQVPPDNGTVLASLSFSDSSSLSFEFANGVIVMNAQAKEGDTSLEEILNNEDKEGGAAADPVLLYEKLAGKTSPPGLTRAWEAILEAKKNAKGNGSSPPQEVAPLATLDDEVDANGKGEGRSLLTADSFVNK